MTPDDLLDWREGLGLTQAEASTLLGCSREHYNRVETGILNVPKLMPLACAAIYLEIPPWPATKDC